MTLKVVQKLRNLFLREIFEEEHVQQVYEAIAPHFSATRYKRWPIVEAFIKIYQKDHLDVISGVEMEKIWKMILKGIL